MTTATTRADLPVIRARQQKKRASGDSAVIASRVVLASEHRPKGCEVPALAAALRSTVITPRDRRYDTAPQPVSQRC
jgi:hypothetical protein